MIETLEQYNAYKNGEDMVVNVSKHGRIVANSRNEVIETIEALRKVAQAAQDCIYGKEPLSVDEADLKAQLYALPAWILEDGNASQD